MSLGPINVVGILGQSNAGGTGPLDPAIDLDVAGIDQWNNNINVAGYDQISSDITPLLSPRPPEFSAPDVRNKIGIGDYFARQIFANGFINSATDRLLIVNGARGSTGMITGGREWKTTAPLGELMQGAIDQCTKAVIAAQAIHPDSRFIGFLWGQGENEVNNGGGRDAYMTAFIQLRDLIRAQVPTASNCWALLGSMVPDWVKISPAPLPIQQAHMRLAFENDGVYFDQAPLGLASGSNNIIHYDSSGYRSYGAQLGDALPDLIADPRIVYDFRGDEIGDGAAANSDELLGTFQHGGTRLTLQNGTSVGLGPKCISAAGTPSGIGGAGIEFLPNSNAGDVSLEWTANLSGRQSVTLRASGSYGFFGFDGYLFRVDGDNTVALFDITGGANTNITPDTPSKPLGVTGTTARFRASAVNDVLRFEVSNDDGASWTTVLETTHSSHLSGRMSYMQGGAGTTGSQIYAENFVLRRPNAALPLPQVLRPTNDVSDGLWSGSTGNDLSALVNEEVADDADYIWTRDDSAECELAFGAGVTPQGGANTGHLIRVRAQGSGTADLVLTLMQGANQIAQWTEVDVPATPTDFEFTLTEVEAGNITNYADLRLRIRAVA